MNKLRELLVMFMIGFVIGFIVIFIIFSYQLEQKDKVIDKVNQARIRAENKECCQVIQERYIEKRISEDGLNFIYEEHPKIISCSDEYNYKGVGIIG